MHGSRKRAPFAVAAAVSLAAALVAQPPASAQAPALVGGQPRTVIVVMNGSCTPVVAASGPSASCAQQEPVLAQLESAGATVLSTTRLVDTITASVSAAEAQVLLSLPGVAQVVPDANIPLAQPGVFGQEGRLPPVRTGGPGPGSAAGATAICGTQARPELNPEALQAINAPAAWSQGIDGAGVTVGAIADGIDPANPDLLRNAAYGQAGTPVVNPVDFSGDPTGTPATGSNGEMFLDVSSIAAQGNQEYNLAQYVNPAQAARMPAGGCWIRVVGAAPGANVMALKVFSDINDTTTSNFIQAIQYAVQHGVKVINESFSAFDFPDTALNVIRQADDAAVAAGVVVVVASGDAGNTNTIGSPASDPNVISVGATTTLRSYAQINYFGFDNPVVGNGRWVDNNISPFSSDGFTQAGNTVNLVAPGDTNWFLCSTDTVMYPACSDGLGGTDNGVAPGGGTSESAPLTAAAAADVIQAYAHAHSGTDPTPALVKQILVGSATDIGAPADEQGAGLLNIAAAVKLAESLRGPTGDSGHSAPSGGGLLLSPSQVNFAGQPGSPQSQQITLTNTGSSTEHVELSTRALTREVSDSGVQTFTIDPSKPTTNTGTMVVWQGVTEVYQTETFTVPHSGSGSPSRLLFSADYQSTGQNGVLHVALFEPDGRYAASSGPIYITSDYIEVEVSDPPPGPWTALFFTVQDDSAGDIGTSGPVQWDAQTWQYAPAGLITPASIDIPAGQTATASLSLTTPTAAGDTDQSVVVSSADGQTTIPVTVRSMVATAPSGGSFNGVLTGDDGYPGVEAQSNTYYFDVPPAQTDLDASVTLANNPSAGLVPGDVLLAYLVDPNGQTVGYSSNSTLEPTSGGLQPTVSRFTQIYHVAPVPGQWELVLYWYNPVVGDELNDAFTGAITFNQVNVGGNLPDSASVAVPALTSTAFDIHVENTGAAPEAFFVDPRLDNQSETVNLPNQNPAITASAFAIPLPAGLSFPYYLVPAHTTQVQASVSSSDGSTPVTFDLAYFGGDPDLSPAVASPGTTGSLGPGSASLTFTENPEVSPGFWYINPDEIGPYPSTGMPIDAASASLSAVTQAFDPAITTSTGNLWDGSLSNFLYLMPGQRGTIEVDIDPAGSPGTVVSGTLYVDDLTLGAYGPYALPDGDELAAIPYEYATG
jgi:hypothetical protein